MTMIRPLLSIVSSSPAPERPPMTVYIARITEAGGVILTTTRTIADDVTVTAVERPPATLEAFRDRLQALCDDFPALPPNTRVVIDAEGLGSALWDALRVDRRRGWQLYAKRGRERQELPDALRVAQLEQRIHIHKGEHDDALRKALLGYRVEVREDGIIGGELVVALCLAVAGKRPPKVRVY
ncbi:MAG TPA: hypothetical protein VIK08_00640 [Candidatus Limnocylindrales bacterium]